MNPNKAKLLNAAMAGLIAAGGASLLHINSAHAQDAKGECHGVNACKGEGACGGAGHSCAGNNACKGQGWTETTEKECKEKKGTWQSKKMEMKKTQKKG